MSNLVLNQLLLYSSHPTICSNIRVYSHTVSNDKPNRSFLVYLKVLCIYKYIYGSSMHVRRLADCMNTAKRERERESMWKIWNLRMHAISLEFFQIKFIYMMKSKWIRREKKKKNPRIFSYDHQTFYIECILNLILYLWSLVATCYTLE